MDDGESLYIRLDFWDEAVAAFEPRKVLRQLKMAFSNVEIDPADHQQVRLLRELEYWADREMAAELREVLVQQSWGLYQTNGPSYRFVIPFPSGHRVSGEAARLSVGFQMPAGLPPESREQLLVFLRSLRMGEPAGSCA